MPRWQGIHLSRIRQMMGSPARQFHLKTLAAITETLVPALYRDAADPFGNFYPVKVPREGLLTRVIERQQTLAVQQGPRPYSFAPAISETDAFRGLTPSLRSTLVVRAVTLLTPIHHA